MPTGFIRNFDFLPPHVQHAVREHLESAITGDRLDEARARFLPFVRRVWPDFIHGRHRDVMADGYSI